MRTITTVRSGVAKITPIPHAITHINIWKRIIYAGRSFTIFCCISGVINSHSIFCIITYVIITPKANHGETVNATSAAGIIAMSGPKFGIKLSAHAINAKSNA